LPEPSGRTRSKKRHNLRVPGGRLATRYKREKPSSQICSRCGGELAGTQRLIPSKSRKLPASQRRIERVYGGQLCHDCLRVTLRQAARRAHAP